MLEEIYGVSLPYPTLVTDLNQLNKFCSGLIEKDGTHLWKTVVSSLSARSRMGLAHSLFLFRKVIPKKKPDVQAYLNTMAEAQPHPDPHFLDFARKETGRLFRSGWDRKYCRKACTSVLSTSSCAEEGRKTGGGRGITAQSKWLRSEFCSYVMTSARCLPRRASKVCIVETGGKWRTISIAPRVDRALSAFHDTMYDHLSQFKWLLRGDAKSSKFKDFFRVDGEIFTSGDYENATDNLNLILQRAILDELLSSSVNIPEGIKEHAQSLYSPSLLEYSGTLYARRRGQLMGDLTSFPLLCLVNYITFRYSTRRLDPFRRIPVRVNGDDIVFRSSPAVSEKWESDVAKGGLTLSKGKTLKDPRFFTLNSCLFEGGRSKARGVGFVRPRAIWSSTSLAEQVLSLNSRFYSSSVSMGGDKKRLVRQFFLRQNEKAVHASRRSITRGLGLCADREMLHCLGMWHRELFYLEPVIERPLPSLVKGGVPDGYVQVNKSWLSPEMLTEATTRFYSALTSFAWTEPYDPKTQDDDALFAAIREGCSPYGINHFTRLHVVRRMLRLTRREMWQWVYIRRNESVFGRVRPEKAKRVWVHEDMLGSLRQHVFFVKPI